MCVYRPAYLTQIVGDPLLKLRCPKIGHLQGIFPTFFTYRGKQEALEIARKIGYLQGESSTLVNIGVVYRQMGELDKAIRYLKDVLKINKSISNKEDIKKLQKQIDEIDKINT